MGFGLCDVRSQEKGQVIPHDRYFQACDFVDRGDGGGQGVQTARQGHRPGAPRTLRACRQAPCLLGESAVSGTMQPHWSAGLGTPSEME